MVDYQKSEGNEKKQLLYEKLAAGRSGRLILIIAPSGSGKTAALKQWTDQHMRSGEKAAAWLDMENSGDRCQYFITDLLQAVIAAVPDFYLPESPPGIDPDTEDRMIDLINALAFREEYLILILDNYHAVQDHAIHQAVELLLDYMPANVQAVIAARCDPPLQVARLRVRRQLVEIREKN